MKRLILLVGLLQTSYAFAAPDSFSYLALKGKSFCGTGKTPFIAVDSNVKKLLGESFADSLSQSVSNRLNAYRVKMTSTCSDAQTVFLSISVEMTNPDSATKAFILNVSVYDFDKTSFFMNTKWNDYFFGYTQKPSNEINDYFKSNTLAIVDSLAADYAKANP